MVIFVLTYIESFMFANGYPTDKPLLNIRYNFLIDHTNRKDLWDYKPFDYRCI